ncbi:MAG TPA: HAMP domain-containing sensor histidine kinase [Gemmataceae bacterium]|nr:HAMP domain-containing sensor histidine kinase [Gemmataceae bacterium]
MSYRAFKRLLGETSLERKCRFLFGAATLLLITASFWWHAHQTESLAYNQVMPSARLLVDVIIRKLHEDKLLLSNDNLDEGPPHPDKGGNLTRKPLSQKELNNLLRVLDEESEKRLPESLQQYRHLILKPGSRNRVNEPNDSYETQLLQKFKADPDKKEDFRIIQSEPYIDYYGAIRAGTSCMTSNCHPLASEREGDHELSNGDLLAVVKIRMPTEAIEKGVHQNRAWLITTALVTAILIMTGSYLIVRYIIVKPVKHLKEVSDAISAGELNVRSEIQTGDEFEDLSHAFNRMLRSLVSMQDRLKKVNANLDLKVDELAQANMALYESNRLKSDFLATMSHELRTPLSSILGFSDVLLSSGQLNDKQQRWASNIQTSGEQLLNLINDILDLAKIEAGKMEVRIEEFSIHDVFEGLVSMFRPLAEKKNIDLRSQISTDLPLLRQDAGKLQQILSNLLSNAIKFTPEGGRVLLKADAEPLHVVVTVTDTGVGIALEDQELIFEKFRQAGNPLTREHAGTGLGLSIVRELSKLLGGEVALQSELGRGSTFTVRLPLQLSAESRLEFDLADQRIDLSKAQRVDGAIHDNSALHDDSAAGKEPVAGSGEIAARHE